MSTHEARSKSRASESRPRNIPFYLWIFAAAIALASSPSIKAQTFSRITDNPVPTVADLANFASLGDYDGDGDLDILVTRHTNSAGAGLSQLYRNDAGVFTEVQAGALTATASVGSGAAWADYDNDGDLDVYISNENEPGNLFRNNGNGTFTLTTTAIPAQSGYGNGAAWADYDRDGWVDLFVARTTGNALYHNNGNGTFTQILTGPPVTDSAPWYGCGWADFDGDGDLDLVVAGNASELVLYRNDGSTFTRLPAAQSGLGTANWLGVAWGDYDNDGDPDLMVGGGNGDSKLYRNDNGVFTDVTTAAGIPSINGTSVAWGDVDNDGDLDLYVAAGPDGLFLNNGNGTFTKFTGGAPTDAPSDGAFTVAFGDLNGDGKLDIHIGTGQGQTPRRYRNDTANGHHWLIVKCIGTSSNRSGIGAKISATTGALTQHRLVESGGGYLAQANLWPHFGFGAATTATVTVRWPSGIVQTLSNVAADQVLTLTEPPLLVPSITALSAQTGKPGDVLTITGTNFSAVPAQNAVMFGGVKALVNAASATSLMVTVPSGLGHTRVSVTVGGRTGYSAASFVLSTPSNPAIDAGRFTPSSIFPTGNSTTDVVPADLDGDGKPDLVVANESTACVSVLRNTGSAGNVSFAANVALPMNANSHGVAVADLDGDGKPDIVAVSESSLMLTVYKNQSSPGSLSVASFAAGFQFAAGTTGTPTRVTVSDLDRDGRPDLVVSTKSSTIAIVRNLTIPGGPLNFAAPVPMDTQQVQVWQVAAGDFNGDGYDDLVCAHNGASFVTVLPNSAQSGPIAFGAPIQIAMPGGQYCVGTADADGDGKIDFYSSVTNGSALVVARNQYAGGALTASSFAVTSTAETGANQSFVAAGDLNGDGRLELLEVNSTAGNTVRVFQKSAGGFVFSGAASLAGFSFPLAAAVADFDGDGRPDVVVSDYNATPHGVIVLRNQTPAPPPAIASGGLSTTTGQVGTTITITGSGFSPTLGNNLVYFGGVRATVTAATATSLTLTVPPGASFGPISITVGGQTVQSQQYFTPTFAGGSALGAGSFAAPTQFSGSYPVDFAVGDLDNDGAPDIVTANAGLGTGSNGTLTIFRNLLPPGSLATGVPFPAGTLSSQALPGATLATGSARPFSVTMADLDGDGKLDLIAPGGDGANTVSIFRKSTAGDIYAFDPGVVFATQAQPTHALATDLDGDGLLDLVVLNRSSSTISVLRRTSAPGLTGASFSAAVNFPINGTGFFVAAGDLDGDGKPELVAGTSTHVCILRNQATPGVIDASSFAARIDIATGEELRGVRLADLDGDGDLDLVGLDLRNNDGFEIPVLRNVYAGGALTAASFQRAADLLGNSTDQTQVEVADLDGDGRPDVGGMTGINVASVWRNLGSGNFAARVDISSNLAATSGHIADLDGDGRPDLIGTRDNAGQLTLLRNITLPPAPTITALSAITARAGQSITITGTGFSATPAANVVRFGGKSAIVTTASATSLTVTVPNGASHGPVTAMVGVQTAYSAQLFTPRSIGFGAFDASSFAAKREFSGGYLAQQAVGDIDGDGRVDVVTSNGDDQVFKVFHNELTQGGLTATEQFPASTFPVTIFSMSAGGRTAGIALEDLNGDGKLDVITALYLNAQIAVFLNTSTPGNISFQAQTPVTVGGLPQIVAARDLDGDGRPDIAVSNQNGASISILPNTSPGDGTLRFGTVITYSGLTSVFSIAAADLNGDGKPELIAGNVSTGAPSVLILSNRSTPGVIDFDVAGRAEFNLARGIYSVLPGDFDGDGKIDLMLGSINTGAVGPVTVLYNTHPGNGSAVTASHFATRKEIATAASDGHPYGSLGDLNGDSTPDAVFGNTGNTQLNVLLNQSPAAGSPPLDFTKVTGVLASGLPTGTSIVDLDGDGRNDVITSGPNSATVILLRNIQPLPLPPLITPVAVTLPGFTDANLQATVTPNSFTTTVTFQYGPNASYGFMTSPQDIGARSGGVLVSAPIAQLSPGTTYHFRVVATNQGGTTMGPDQMFTTLVVPPKITGLSAGSGAVGSFLVITGSGFSPAPTDNAVFFGGVRAVVTGATANTLTVLVPAGASYAPVSVTVGGLSATSPKPFANTFSSNRVLDATSFATGVPHATGTNPSGVAVGDIDADGKPDLIVANQGSSSISVLHNISSPGSLTAASFAPRVDFDTSSGPEGLTVADFDGDGRLDVATVAPGNRKVGIFINARRTGAIDALSFNPRLDLDSGAGSPIFVAAGDLNGDGRPDLAVANAQSNTVAIFTNTTSGGVVSFSGPQLLTAGNDVRAVALADLDHDGLAELVVSYLSSAYVSVFRNTSVSPGAIAFAADLQLTSANTCLGLAVADVDGDGELDIQATNFSPGQFTTYRRVAPFDTLTAASFVAATSAPAGSTASRLALGDLNGDALPDTVAINGSASGVAQTYRNISGPGSVQHVPGFTTEAANNPYGIAIADLDLDGKPDLVVSVYGAASVSLYRNVLPAAQAPPEFHLSANAYVVGEGDGTASITIERNFSEPASVQLKATDGNPDVNSDDFTESTQTFAFAQGEMRKVVGIRIENDPDFEGDESFSVLLLNPSGGAVLGAPAEATVTIVDNDPFGETASVTSSVLPSPRPDSRGALTVTIEPLGIGQWRLLGQRVWRNSGNTLTGLTTGNYVVEFRPVPGYLKPDNVTVAVTAGLNEPPAELPATYLLPEGGAPVLGGVVVTIQPPAIANALDPAHRGQWRLEGESAFRDSGTLVEGLPAGRYVIEFKTLPTADLRATPPSVSVTIPANSTAATAGVYYNADQLEGADPQLAAQSLDSAPYCFNGQLQTDTGFASGSVVRDRVVLTAAHVIFDDATLAFATGVLWFFQRDQGAFEPPPQAPRGSYLFQGYSAQRGLDASPGTSTPQSQALDLATLFFLESAGRGGASGYLTSNDDNDWLGTPRAKFLAGYAIDGVPEANRGQLFATLPAEVTFSRRYAGLPVPEGANVYFTRDIHGLPGMSGGPLYVQLDDGRFFVAGIYLGGSQQTLVRALDAKAGDLISRADISGNGGDNHVGGGITLVDAGFAAPSFALGSLAVNLGPADAVAAGAGWRLVGESSYLGNGKAKTGLAPKSYTVEFKPVPGYVRPGTNGRLTKNVSAGASTPLQGIYVKLSPPVINSPALRTGAIGQPFTHTIAATNAPTSYALTGTLPPGLIFDAATGTISGTPVKSGEFVLTLGAGNLTGNDTQTFTLRIATALLGAGVVPLAELQPYDFELKIADPATGATFATGTLPAGLTFDAATHHIRGAVTTAGQYDIALSATNAGGTATATLTLLVAPAVDGPDDLSEIVILDKFLRYPLASKLQLSDPAAVLRINALPPGLALSVDGEIIGMPTMSGNFRSAITITEGGQTTPATLLLRVTAALRVSIVGSGSVTPMPDASGVYPPLPGQALRLTATPAAGWLFAGWSGATSSTSTVLDFMSQTDRDTLTARFVRVRDLTAKYSGLLRDNPATFARSGFVTVSVAATGALSGSVNYGGVATPFKGKLDGLGATFVIKRPRKLPPLTLALRLDPGGESFSGTVTEGQAVSAFTAARHIYQARVRPVPSEFVGAYTVLIEPTVAVDGALEPPGHGAATLRVGAAGTMLLSGVLADGTPVSCGIALIVGPRWPLFVPLYGGRGAILGDVQLDRTNPESDVQGSLAWYKQAAVPGTKTYPNGWPAGLARTLSGARYTAPFLPAGTPLIGFSGGNLNPAPAPFNFTVSSRGVITAPRGFVLRPVASTGYFTGTYAVPGDKTVTAYRGAVYQKKTTRGAGNFTRGGVGGSVDLVP